MLWKWHKKREDLTDYGHLYNVKTEAVNGNADVKIKLLSTNLNILGENFLSSTVLRSQVSWFNLHDC
jgi:hypothetical protein